MNIRIKKMNTVLVNHQTEQKPNQKTSSDGLNFLTPTVMTVLEFFLANPMENYYGREVSRKTGVSLGSANKILRLLTKLEFLTIETKGKMVIYSLNLKEPIVKQFKILLNVFSLKDLVSKLKLDSRRVVLFGSCAQGTDTKESDIDLLIVTAQKEEIKKTIATFNRASQRHIEPIIVNMNEYISLKKEDTPLYENIERGIILWEAE
jgi:predicted nucleotidyltransferase